MGGRRLRRQEGLDARKAAPLRVLGPGVPRGRGGEQGGGARRAHPATYGRPRLGREHPSVPEGPVGLCAQWHHRGGRPPPGGRLTRATRGNQGTTDSEVFFAYLLTHLDAAGAAGDERSRTTTDADAALARAVSGVSVTLDLRSVQLPPRERRDPVRVPEGSDAPSPRAGSGRRASQRRALARDRDGDGGALDAAPADGPGRVGGDHG